MKKKKFDLSTLMRSKITWAVIAEMLILMVCLIVRPEFFKISYQPSTGMLYGSLIDIINRSAEITIIAMGMTLVIALGGTDLSVGALVAVSGAFALKFMRWDVLMYNTPGNYSVLNGAVNRSVCKRYARYVEAGILHPIERSDCKTE